MRNHDLRNALMLAQRGVQGGQMGRVVGAGIDHGDRAVAQQPGVGATLGHRRGVGRQEQPQAGRHAQRHPRSGGEIGGAVVGFWHGGPRILVADG